LAVNSQCTGGGSELGGTFPRAWSAAYQFHLAKARLVCVAPFLGRLGRTRILEAAEMLQGCAVLGAEEGFGQTGLRIVTGRHFIEKEVCQSLGLSEVRSSSRDS
jgi:hypothetical protein